MISNGPANKHHLESLKFFPYVAWALVLGFSLFVYNITQELKAVAENLETHAKQQSSAPVMTEKAVRTDHE